MNERLFRRLMQQVFHAAAADAGAGGTGGGAAGAAGGSGPGGTGGGAAPAAAPTPAGLTEEDVARIAGRVVNGAITERLDRFRKDAIDPISGGIEDIKKRLGTGPTGASGPAAGATTGQDGVTDPRYAALEGRIKEQEAQVAAERAKREKGEQAAAAERAEHLRAEERADLARVAAEHNVNPRLVQALIALLHTERRAIGRGTEPGVLKDRPVFLVQKTGYVEQIPLDAGLKAFLATDEGKSYLAASGAGGAGGGAGPAPRPGAKATKADRHQAAMALLMRDVRGGRA